MVTSVFLARGEEWSQDTADLLIGWGSGGSYDTLAGWLGAYKAL